MYRVSEAYIEQMMKSGTRRRLSGTIGSVAFSGDDIVQGSFSVSGRATEESDTKIGGVYLGELEMTFVPSFLNKVARNQYEGKVVTISIGLWIDSNSEWVDVPVGVYTLQAPKISKQGISVTGYDNMSKLDKAFQIDTTSGSVYGYMSYIASQCGVEIGNTQAEIEALPNGDEVLGLYTPNDIETYRDLLYWIAQSCGCFACAGKDGKIYLRQFGVETEIEFDENHRDTDVVFSGYTTKWTGVSFVDIESQMTNYYGLEIDDGLTMNMGANPLLQTGSAIAIERRRRAVLNAVADIQYTPFYMNSARDPIFDLGDEIPFTGGISGDSTGCVMAYSYTLTNFNFEGYGDNPALANARSKTDKNIAGLMQTTKENDIIFYQYTNIDEMTFGSEQEVLLAKLRFTASQKTTVKILHEFVFDMLKDLAINSSYEIRYYLDDNLLPYSPTESIEAISDFTSGTDTAITIARDLFYILRDVEPNTTHTWQVKMIAHGISQVHIGMNHIHVSLEGQRLYGDTYFDGLIEAEDTFAFIPIGALGVLPVADSVEIKTPTIVNPIASDNVPIYSIKAMQVVGFTDSASIHMESGLPWETENSLIWETEDGQTWQTE